MNKGIDPELTVEQIDLSFRVLDDMESFLAERGASTDPSVVADRAGRISGYITTSVASSR